MQRFVKILQPGEIWTASFDPGFTMLRVLEADSDLDVNYSGPTGGNGKDVLRQGDSLRFDPGDEPTGFSISARSLTVSRVVLRIGRGWSLNNEVAEGPDGPVLIPLPMPVQGALTGTEILNLAPVPSATPDFQNAIGNPLIPQMLQSAAAPQTGPWFNIPFQTSDGFSLNVASPDYVEGAFRQLNSGVPVSIGVRTYQTVSLNIGGSGDPIDNLVLTDDFGSPLPYFSLFDNAWHMDGIVPNASHTKIFVPVVGVRSMVMTNGGVGLSSNVIVGYSSYPPPPYTVKP